MKFLCAFIVAVVCFNSAEAQQYNGGGGYGGGFAGVNNMVGEQDASSLINCQCAMLVQKGREKDSPACANFGRLYQSTIINAGSVTGAVAPGAATPHL